MGIVAELRDEHGGVIRGLADPAGGTFDAAGDFDRLLSDDDPSFAVLRCVDRYGDTVLNSLQMPDLLADLDRLGKTDLQSAEHRGLARLRAIAECCRDGAHLYVWFVGD
jgi:hypothetical protein